MATLHFRNAVIYAGVTTAQPITEAADVSLNVERDLADDSVFGDSWHTNQLGLRSWSASFGGNYDTAQSVLFTIATTQTAASPLYIYPTRSDTAKFYSGTGWFNLSVNGGVSDVGKFTVDVQGDGALAQAT